MEAVFYSLAVLVVATVCAVALTLIPPLWNGYLESLPKEKRRHLQARGWFGFLSDQVGGYVHDTSLSVFIPPQVINCVTGTWADAAGAVANTIAKKSTLGDATTTITIPLALPLQSSVAQKGAYLKTVDVWFEISGAAVTALDALIYKATHPADTAAYAAPTSLAFSYDTGHDTAAERDDLDEHKMTLTLTTPIWVDDDELVTVEIIIDGATSCVVWLYGARANFTLRV